MPGWNSRWEEEARVPRQGVGAWHLQLGAPGTFMYISRVWDALGRVGHMVLAASTQLCVLGVRVGRGRARAQAPVVRPKQESALKVAEAAHL